MFALLDAFDNFKDYDIIKLFAIVIQILFGVAVSGSCWILTSLHTDLVPMFNELLRFESSLPIALDHHENRNILESYPVVAKLRNKLDFIGIFFDGRNFDIIGIASIGLVFGFTIIPFLLPEAWPDFG